MDRAERRRQIWVKYQQLKARSACARCQCTDPEALQHHHRTPHLKEMEISHMVSRGYSWRAILNELCKCVVLCANCHAIVEAERRAAQGLQETERVG